MLLAHAREKEDRLASLAAAQARLGSPLFSTLLVGTQFAVASFLLIAVTVISMQNAQMRSTALSSIEDPLVRIREQRGAAAPERGCEQQLRLAARIVRGACEARGALLDQCLDLRRHGAQSSCASCSACHSCCSGRIRSSSAPSMIAGS